MSTVQGNIVKFSADGKAVYAVETGGEYIWCEQDKVGNLTRKSKRKAAKGTKTAPTRKGETP